MTDDRYVLNRTEANLKRRRKFMYFCPTHGETEFSVKDGDCIACRPVSPRAEARRNGQTVYMGECEKHGRVPHHVQRGKCLTCYNAQGSRRPEREEGSVYVIEVDRVVGPSGKMHKPGIWRRTFGDEEFWFMPKAVDLGCRGDREPGLVDRTMWVPVGSEACAEYLKNRGYGPLAPHYHKPSPEHGPGRLYHGSDGLTYLA